MTSLRPFQRRFLRGALASGIDTAALSVPRGNGKSWLAAWLVARALRNGIPRGTEVLLCAASLEQARIVFRFVRSALEPLGGYRFLDSANRIGITHRESNTRLRVISSSGRTAMGIVGCPLLIADEPGAWEVRGGELMHDAIQTAQGKPGSPLRVIYIGTLAPALSGWWHDMIADGSRRSVYVQALQGDRKTWDQWPTIRKANPLCNIDARFRRKLLEERDEARRDTRLKARFLSYRLNLPTADESTVLLTVDDWERVTGRPVPAPNGPPIVGVDLGGGRSWSAAVALTADGRGDCLAVAPGVPDIAAQERRDRMPRGTYQRLVDDGTLRVAEGLRVPPPSMLAAAIRERWGEPRGVVCDRFRLAELRDAAPRWRLSPRVARWSEATEDIRALRRMALDGPLSWDPGSRALMAASLAVAEVKNDDQGNHRLVKRTTDGESRDDVAAALLLAAGSLRRYLAKGGGRTVYLGVA
ncbi:hypothetical protein [Candidatus Palauibacter sp.]|uniref:hypothetical protein n=1 Tax=Candidatus Palauibacter sp. TaxID=3101350 RepID=UPI003B029B13